MSWIVFGRTRPAVYLNVVESLHNIKTNWFHKAAKSAGPWQGMLGSAAQPSTSMVLNGCITSRQKCFSTPWKELGRVWGSTTSRWFENCWHSAKLHDEKTLQCREMSCAVTGDFGKRGPAINLNGFKWLQIIQTKKFFNTVKRAGPCFGEHGPAINSIVIEKFYTIQTKKIIDTVKWAGSCLGEHD